ncbi:MULTISPECIES: hypothetical protein [Sphingobium]|uniref:hypothetical protein n=1 Tax=Sphingobium TaxID=165695 RepID=UPI0013DDF0ED|nr:MULTISPECIES: hypothetical protein [Sphingobium]
MDEKDIQRQLDAIRNPSETELVQERANVARENRLNRSFFLSLMAFAILTWILAGLPGI